MNARDFDVVVIGSAPGFEKAVNAARRIGLPHVVLLRSANDYTTVGDDVAALAISNIDALSHVIRREMRLAVDRKRACNAWSCDVIEHALDGVWVVDADGKTTFANPRMAEMLGCTGDELLNRDASEFVPGENRANLLEGRDRRMSGIGDVADYELRRKDGTPLWVSSATTPQFDEAGRYCGVVAFVSDITERKRVEEGSRRREAHLSVAQNLARMGGWEWRLEDDMMIATPELFQLLAIDSRNATMDQWLAMVDRDDVDVVREDLRTAAREGTDFERTFRMFRGDGAAVVIHSRAQAMRDASNRVVSLIGMAQDVTLETMAERALAESEKRYRDLVSTIPDAMWTWTARGTIPYASVQMEDLTGFTAAEWVNGGSAFWATRVHPGDIDRLMSQWNDLFARGHGSFESDYRFLRKDDRWVWLQQRITLEPRPDGQAYAVGISSDITAHRLAEEALRNSEVRYRTLVEQASDIIFSLDADGKITSLNGAFEQITGWKGSEWIGRPFTDVLDTASIEQTRQRFRGVISGELAGTNEFELRTQSGRALTIEAKAQPINIDGQLLGTVGIARDITKRRETETEAAKEKRLASLGQLATSVAHEFNNVLMSILPFAELMQHRFPEDERVLNAMSHIIQAVKRGRDISQSVMRYARPIKPALEPVIVGQWLEDFAASMEKLLGPLYRVRRAVPSHKLVITADRALLEQTATSIVINAREAMPRGGTIAIDATRSTEHGMIDIAVHDTGGGIEPSLIEHIFEPLFTTKRRGSGLGLSVAYQAMKQQDGTIRVRSTVGEGSTFTLSFPENTAWCSEPESEPAIARRRILIVEDDETIGEGLSVLLGDEGFDVRLVTRGAESPAAVVDFHPDVVLLDVNLPDASGVDVYEQIRRSSPRLQVIFSTGDADARVLDSIRERQVPTIMKPYDVNELMNIINALPAGA
ncbi:MAG TPA: PAS domain S-box protein [Thermoanaerobaculia bacterium]